jgi:hypothetical protein
MYKMENNDQEQVADMWDPAHAQSILMPCDGASRLIRACYRGDWEDLQKSLTSETLRPNRDKTRNLASIQSQLGETHRAEHAKGIIVHEQPCRENGFKGLKGAERLEALEKMEAEDELEDKRMNPEFLGIEEQVFHLL